MERTCGRDVGNGVEGLRPDEFRQQSAVVQHAAADGDAGSVDADVGFAGVVAEGTRW